MAWVAFRVLCVILLWICKARGIVFPTPIRLTSKLPTTFPKPSIVSALLPAEYDPPLQRSSQQQRIAYRGGLPGTDALKQFTNLLSAISSSSPREILLEDKSEDRLLFLHTYEVLSQLDCCECSFHTSAKGDAISLNVAPPPPPPPPPSSAPDDVTTKIKEWVSVNLVERNLCPYTASPTISSTKLAKYPPGRIIYGVSPPSSSSILVLRDQLSMIVEMLETGDGKNNADLKKMSGVSSILHSSPCYDDDFQGWCELFNLLPAVLELCSLEKDICVVNFHPLYTLPQRFVGFGHMHTLSKLKRWINATPEPTDEDVRASGEFQRRMPHATLNVLWAKHMEEGESERDSSELYTNNYLGYMEQKERQPQSFDVLALHGKGGSGAVFKSKLTDLEASGLTFKYLDAPFEGGQWWKLKPGERSFEASSYDGFEESVEQLKSHLQSSPRIIIGHSQGGILIAAVLSLCGASAFKGVDTIILNGLAYPKPYPFKVSDEKVEGLKVVVIRGGSDKMNPPEQADLTIEGMRNAGFTVDVIKHDGGHAFPRHAPKVMDELKTYLI